jgi:transposase/ssDNA-binding Zn-finger/Zn-ribbon topoisomerase 1
MDRELIEGWLEEGLSLREMGERAGLHASTMSYWLAKHGLRPAGRDRHRARGGMDSDELAGLVQRDLSIRQIAAEVDRSPATVQYWLRLYGLRTSPAARLRRARLERRPGECQRHGSVEMTISLDGGVVCPRCKGEAVARRRRRTKAILVAEAGGVCVACGYGRCQEALQFHHLDPSTKHFGVGGRGLTHSMERLRDEAAKCVLLCARCHVEVEHGHREIPATMSRSEPGSDVAHDPG